MLDRAGALLSLTEVVSQARRVQKVLSASRSRVTMLTGHKNKKGCSR
jgi:hypothetical protein